MTQVLPRRVSLDLSKARAALAADPKTSPAVLVLTRVLGLLAALALWFVFFGVVLSSLAYSHAQGDLYAKFRSQLAGGVAPLGGAISEGAPVALISSSVAGLNHVVVVEGSSSKDLESGPGHRPGTPLPGQAGVSLLLGRATSFGAPFAGITKTKAGDTFSVTTGQGTFTYVVEDVRGPGDPIPAFPASGSQLTLVTAQGSGWRSGWAPTNAVSVDAALKGTPAAAPAGAAVPAERDGLLKHDTRGLFPLVLWLQLLLVAGVGGVWIASRWGAARAWLISVPIGAAALWGASLSVWLLLPNLL